MDLNHLFTFEGRLNRSRYFLTSIISGFIIGFLGSILAILLGLAHESLTFIVYLVMVVILVWINISVVVRRLHDLDRSGWFWLLQIIPLVNIGLAIYLLFFKGTTGPNKYGPDPLAQNPVPVPPPVAPQQ
jgi:uncharacterized membrane protein YhaH (DUF805 family)